MVRIVYQSHRAWIVLSMGAGFLAANMPRRANDNEPPPLALFALDRFLNWDADDRPLK